MALVTVGSDGGSYDYSTLASAIGASETEIEIQGTWSSAETLSADIAISSATTITATGSAKHPGYVGSSPTHYRIIQGSNGQHTFELTADVEFIGIDLSNASTGISDEVIRLNADNVDLICRNCLLWFDSRNNEQDLIYNNSKSGCSVLLESCIGWNAKRAVIDQFQGGGATYTINSCHFYNIGFDDDSSYSRSGIIGINGGGTVTANIFNSLLHLAVGYAITTYGVKTVNIDRCVTNASGWYYGWTTPTVTDSLVSHTWTDNDTKSSDGDWVIVEDITTAPYDFRLATNDYNEAQDAHTDGSGVSLTMPSTDIVGTSRPQNTNYDIGAFEIAVSSGSPLLPNNLTVGTPVLGSPDIGQIHAISSTGISAAPALGVVSIGQVHILSSTSISATPALDTSTVGQIHALASTGISSTPVLGTPTASSESTTDSLTAIGISSAPEISAATLGQIHALGVSAFLSGTPAISDPVIEQIHALLSTAISLTPVITSPVCGIADNTDVLLSNGITTADPIVGDIVSYPDVYNWADCDVSVPGVVTTTGTKAGCYSLTAFDSGNAQLSWKAGQTTESECWVGLADTYAGGPGINLVNHAFSYSSGGNISIKEHGDLILDLPGETYSAGTEFKIVYSGVSGTVKYYIDNVLKHTSSGVADDIEFYFMMLLRDQPGLFIYDLLFTQAAPVLSQTHSLTAAGILTTPLFTSPAIDWDAPVVPIERQYDIPAESRIWAIENENRIYTITTENRTITA